MTKTLVLFIALAVIPTAPLSGQGGAHSSAAASVMLSSHRIGAARSSWTRSLLPDSMPKPDAGNSRHLWKYLVGGAVIGAVVGGGVGFLAVRHCSSSDSCMFAGPAVMVITSAGTLLGTLFGLLGYADP